MAACPNCLQLVLPGAEICPTCGLHLRGGWRATNRLSPNPHGWGLSPEVLRSFRFRTTALLCPLWLPAIVGLLAQPQPRGDVGGLWILLALFIFLPGVYVIAKMGSGGRTVRFMGVMAYIFLSEVATYHVLAYANRV